MTAISPDASSGTTPVPGTVLESILGAGTVWSSTVGCYAAILAVMDATRQEAPAIAALPEPKKKELLSARLATLKARGLLTVHELDALHVRASGGDAPGLSLVDPATGGYSLAGMLDIALASPPTEISLGGGITVGLAAAGGAVLGGIAGGPVGAIVGAAVGGFIAAESVT